MNDDQEVLVETRGRLGLLTLNRPRAINALTRGMVITVSEALDRWRDDTDVATIAIIGAGDRGLCAGGDIVGLYQAATARDLETAAAFWRDEYRMNAAIGEYPKPVVAVQHGIVLGGGMGISAHASHRIVTERSRLGFPEVAIGFVPDVGASWLLSRAPGASGVRLALTAESVGAADAIYLGLSDSFVRSDRVPSLLTALEREDASTAIAILAEDPGPSGLEERAESTDAAFGWNSVPEILDALRAGGLDELARAIEAKSPLAVTAALEALKRARAFGTLEEAVVMEFRVSMHGLTVADFAEGVRAQVIDKDRNPRWSPPDLASVTRKDVESFFATPVVGDLTFPARSTSKEPV